MQINAVSNCDYKNRAQLPSFKMLITDQRAKRLIKSLSDADKLEINNIRERLSKTKYWDLQLSATYGKQKSFIFRFINKDNPEKFIDNDINPYKRDKNTISIYTLNSGKNIHFNTVEVLTYKTQKKAKELFKIFQKKLNEHIEKHWVLSPLENLADREIKLNMLEEAYAFTRGKNQQKVLNTELKTKSDVTHG